MALKEHDLVLERRVGCVCIRAFYGEVIVSAFRTLLATVLNRGNGQNGVQCSRAKVSCGLRNKFNTLPIQLV